METRERSLSAFRLLHSLDGFFRVPSISEIICVSDRPFDSSTHHPGSLPSDNPTHVVDLVFFLPALHQSTLSGCLAPDMRWTECIGSIRLVLECTLPLHADWVTPSPDGVQLRSRFPLSHDHYDIQPLVEASSRHYEHLSMPYHDDA